MSTETNSPQNRTRLSFLGAISRWMACAIDPEEPGRPDRADSPVVERQAAMPERISGRAAIDQYLFQCELERLKVMKAAMEDLSHSRFNAAGYAVSPKSKGVVLEPDRVAERANLFRQQ